jgi:competence protein ComEA
MQKQVVILLCLVTLNMILWPKREPEAQLIHQHAPMPELYEVDIAGAVVFPGRYVFYFPVTVETLISYAGGVLETADISQINLRMSLQRDAQITIPTLQPTETSHQLKINLNQANFQTLYALPYISESIALSILMYREQHGSFQHIDELLNVKYIGPATLEKIKDYFILG